MAKRHKTYPPLDNNRKKIRRISFRITTGILIFVGLLVAYYITFALLFDTPEEHRLRSSMQMLKNEHRVLEERMSEIEEVIHNVVDRDKNVFKILFDSEPYAIEDEIKNSQWSVVDDLIPLSNKEIYNIYTKRKKELSAQLIKYRSLYKDVYLKMDSLGNSKNFIPAIQPVINQELSLLTASFGMRIHPFYKSLIQHNGVDYTMPEGSRVFATADGTVKEASQRTYSTGLSVVISHGNGYETHYNHLSKINIKKGQKIKRGDIIALTGNTGLSLVPHLHYEIRFNNQAVDPLNYFFMELTPEQYRQLRKIAASGMQSFD